MGRRASIASGSAEGSGKSAGERKRRDDFHERGLRGPPRRGAESPSSPGAAARIFLPLSGPLSRPLFFFFTAGPPSRRARCFSSPWTASIFLFERLRSHAPAPQWPRARKFVAGAAPFPATPASFSPIPLTPQPLFSRTPVTPASPFALPSMPFFLSLFLSRPPLRLHLPPTSTSIRLSAVSVARVFAALFSFAPGVYFKRSLEPTPASSRGATARYVRSVLYTILEARNVCARLWPGVYTAAV